jgi:hypothetical protein
MSYAGRGTAFHLQQNGFIILQSSRASAKEPVC